MAEGEFRMLFQRQLAESEPYSRKPNLEIKKTPPDGGVRVEHASAGIIRIRSSGREQGFSSQPYARLPVLVINVLDCSIVKGGELVKEAGQRFFRSSWRSSV